MIVFHNHGNWLIKNNFEQKYEFIWTRKETSMPITLEKWSWTEILKTKTLNFGWAISNTIGTNSILHHKQSKFKYISNQALKVQIINYNATNKQISKWVSIQHFEITQLEGK